MWRPHLKLDSSLVSWRNVTVWPHLQCLASSLPPLRPRSGLTGCLVSSGVPDRGAAGETDRDELRAHETIHRICGRQTHAGAGLHQGNLPSAHLVHLCALFGETAMLYTKTNSNGPSRTMATPLRGSVMMTRAGVRTLASHGGRVLPLSPLEGEWSSRGGGNTDNRLSEQKLHGGAGRAHFSCDLQSNWPVVFCVDLPGGEPL